MTQTLFTYSNLFNSYVLWKSWFYVCGTLLFGHKVYFSLLLSTSLIDLDLNCPLLFYYPIICIYFLLCFIKHFTSVKFVMSLCKVLAKLFLKLQTCKQSCSLHVPHFPTPSHSFCLIWMDLKPVFKQDLPLFHNRGKRFIFKTCSQSACWIYLSWSIGMASLFLAQIRCKKMGLR